MGMVQTEGGALQQSQPPGGKRLRIALAMVVYVLCGTPVWWWLTSLHRPPLPLEAMEEAAAALSTSLPVTIEAYLVLPAGAGLEATAQQLLAVFSSGVSQQWPQGQRGVRLVATVESQSGCNSAAIDSADGNGSSSSGGQAAAAAAAACMGLFDRKADERWWETSGKFDVDDRLHMLLRQGAGGNSSSGSSSGRGDGSAAPKVGRGRAGWYTLLLLPGIGGSSLPQQQPLRRGPVSIKGSWVGRYRHAWTIYTVGPKPAGASQEPGADSLRKLVEAAAQGAARWLQVASCTAGVGEAAAAAGSQTVGGGLPLSPAGTAVLSFSLLNADPTERRYTWDFDSFEGRYVAPLVKTLSPLAQLSVESQVLHYTPTKVASRWSDEHAAWVMAHDELPFFVESEWALESGRAGTLPQQNQQQHGATTSSRCGSSSCCGCGSSGCSGGVAFGSASNGTCSNPDAARSGTSDAAAPLAPHVLHVLVYVPPPQRSPLVVLTPDGNVSPTNSFSIPSWGGVIVVNPQQHDVPGNKSIGGRGGGRHVEDGLEGGEGAEQLDDRMLEKIAGVAAAQLRVLLGLGEQPGSALEGGQEGSSGSSGSTSGGGGSTKQQGEDGLHGSTRGDSTVQHVAAPRSGFAAWEVDSLVRCRMAYDVVEAGRVLRSLAAVVQELPNLEMPDLIGQQVNMALASLSEALVHAGRGAFGAASAAARAAHAAADAAFLHPAVLTQLNFPDSHKLGIYMPLFLPVSVPLLQGAVRELARFIKKWRQWRRQQQQQQQQVKQPQQQQAPVHAG